MYVSIHVSYLYMYHIQQCIKNEHRNKYDTCSTQTVLDMGPTVDNDGASSVHKWIIGNTNENVYIPSKYMVGS